MKIGTQVIKFKIIKAGICKLKKYLHSYILCKIKKKNHIAKLTTFIIYF